MSSAPAASDGPAAQARAARGTNTNIQLLRAVAAYGVVGHHVVDSLRHYIAIGRFPYDPQVGATGVDIFFVISGFVMMLTTCRRPVGPVAFMRNRIARIVPIYWLLTGVVAAVAMNGFALFGNTGVTWSRVLCALFFLPTIGDGGQVVLPLLFTGWTLNYEMMFYLIFAACLLIPGEKRRTIALVGAIAGLWIAQTLSRNAYVDYAGNDVIIGFALGVLLWPVSRQRAPAPAVLVALAGIGIAGLCAIDLPSTRDLPHVRVIVSLAAFLIVYAAVSAERTGHAIRTGWLTRQGDASYSLYLIHPFVIQAIGKISIRFGINATIPGLALTVVVMVVASGFAGLLFHRLIERPIIAILRDRASKAASRRPPMPPAPAAPQTGAVP